MKRAIVLLCALALLWLTGCKPAAATPGASSASPALSAAPGASGAQSSPAATPSATPSGMMLPLLTLSPSPTPPGNTQLRGTLTDALNRYIACKTDAYAQVTEWLQIDPTGYLDLATALLPATLNDTSLTMLATMVRGSSLSQALGNLFGVTEFTSHVEQRGDEILFSLSYYKDSRSIQIQGSYDCTNDAMVVGAAVADAEQIYSRFEYAGIQGGYASQQYTLAPDRQSYIGVQCFLNTEDVAFSILQNLDEQAVKDAPTICDTPPTQVDFCTDDQTYVWIHGDQFTYRLPGREPATLTR